jgi:hypothetical protein
MMMRLETERHLRDMLDESVRKSIRKPENTSNISKGRSHGVQYRIQT